MKVRRAAVAGYFYEADPEDLKRRIEWCFRHTLGPGRLPSVKEGRVEKILGLVSPHAGYMYSGPVAAHGYLLLAEDGIPDTVIIIGPNHTGLGSGVAIMTEGEWETPLGRVPIDTELAMEIVRKSGVVDIDELAHVREHSVEVQIPFLQYIYGSRFKIVPITMLIQTLEVARELGNAIADCIADRNVIVIASTDFTHYEPQHVAERKDKLAIDAILKLSAEELYRVVHAEDISMCGYGPTMTLLVAAKRLGAKSATLLKYATSGDITGDYGAVVGYASIAVWKK